MEEHSKTCATCQLFKKQQKKYGHLPPKKAEINPRSQVNVDLIGPCSVSTKKGKLQLRARTIMDPATNWFEIAPITTPDSDSCQRAFYSYWLA